MKFISLFAGVGGFDLALTRQGHECVYVNEWDKYSAITYEKNFRHKPDTRSITDVPASDIPDHDLLVGGFPCQAFSIAGKRRGFDDTRGTLFFDIARILKEKHPRLLVLENVKGLLSHNNGNTFKTIISTLTELGYDLQWQVLNSKNFGVPQNRERVFIVGHLRGTTRPKVFPIGEDDKGLDEQHGKGVHKSEIASTLTATYWKGGKGSQIMQVNQPTHSNDRVYSQEGISPTLNTMQGGRRQPFVAMRWNRTEKGKRARRESQKLGRDYTPFNDGHRELVPAKDEIIGTITSQAIAKDSLLGSESKIRRLTPLECERLQGFPDNWTSVTQSSIMEVCVNINPAIEKLLPKLDTVLCTTSVGKDTERQICSLEKSLPVTFAIDGLLPESSATDIIKAGNAMVTHYNPKEISPTDMKTQQSHIDDKTGEKSIYKLWKIILAENLPKEKLSTTLTSINEIMTSPIFSSVNQEQNIIGYIILSNSQEQNYIKGKEYPLMVTNTKSLMSDTQRYKQMGNAVTVNVVEAIVKRL